MKSFHSLKGGARKVLPCLEGGAQKVSDPRFSHFVAPPLPVINDQSLRPLCPELDRKKYCEMGVGRRLC